MKFSIKDFFSKCEQIRSFLRIWSRLLKESLMENFIFLCSEWNTQCRTSPITFYVTYYILHYLLSFSHLCEIVIY